MISSTLSRASSRAPWKFLRFLAAFQEIYREISGSFSKAVFGSLLRASASFPSYLNVLGAFLRNLSCNLFSIKLHEEHFLFDTFFSTALHTSDTASVGAKWCQKNLAPGLGEKNFNRD